MKQELNWRVILFGAFICAIAAAATPYAVLKLGMSVDLSFGGMFLAAALLGRKSSGQKLAVELNIIQTMIGAVSGVAFMVVILAAFFYIQVVFGRDIGFNPAWWKISMWLLVSANLGVFMGALTRGVILNDASLPWPTGHAGLNVIQPLADAESSEVNHKRRLVLTVTTAVAGFITFLKDGLGVITPIVGNASVNLMLGPELAAFGMGMLIPLSVGLSGLLGVWIIANFGDTVAKLSALSGTTTEHWEQCTQYMDKFAEFTGDDKTQATAFLTDNCGKAMQFISNPGHFKFVVQWLMWPATTMMITAALTSVIVPMVRNALKGSKTPSSSTLADETIPKSWIVWGIALSVLGLMWIQDAWFGMPWYEVLVAVGVQPLLIIAGLKVVAITGQGPVSLMANATQFLFGLIWPAHISNNLMAAHIAADPQASAENTGAAFWISRRLGGRFSSLVVGQLLVIPVAALLIPLVFYAMVDHYGIGLNPGQLSAPTGLKIATLAMVMEKGVSAMPRGALTASVVAGLIGIVFELLLLVRRRNRYGEIEVDEHGGTHSRFWWIPIPSALGFALILPPVLSLALACGSVVSAAWKKFSPKKDGSYEMYARPLAAGFVAGEAIIGAILLPLLGALLAFLQ